MPDDFSNNRLLRCRVLVVEDRYLVADDLRRLFSRNGAEIVGVVAEAERAKELAASGNLDLAVLDVDLRGQDAFEVAAMLEARGVPFVFVTGFPRTHLPDRYRAHPIVSKPFSEADLLSRIDDVLGDRPAGQMRPDLTAG